MKRPARRKPRTTRDGRIPTLLRLQPATLKNFDQLARDNMTTRVALMQRALAEWLEMETELAA